MAFLQLPLGNKEAVLQAFEKCLPIREQLCAQQPTNADLFRELWRLHDHIGDIQSELGNVEAALNSYLAGSKIAAVLLSPTPQRLDWADDLCECYTKSATLQDKLGKLDQAERSFDAAVKNREFIVAREPNNATYRAHLSCAYEKLADFYLLHGHPKAAEPYYQTWAEFLAGGVDKESPNPQQVHTLSRAYNKWGEAKTQLGQDDVARVLWEKALQIRKWLITQEPNRPDYLLDLAKSLVRLGGGGNLSQAYEILSELQRQNKLPASEMALLQWTWAAVQP
jgi:tetratricopeptide (TPR) repeat protein